MSVESQGASRIAKPASGSGGLANVAKGWLTGKYLSGGSSNEGSSGTGMKGKTAADWHNEEISRRFEFDRTQTGKDLDVGRTKDLSTFTGQALKGHKSADYQADFYDRKPPAPTSSGGQGTSGNKKGAQFDKPMPAFSLPGAGGKRVSNPDYVSWKKERDTFNAQNTAGNVQPVGLAPKPGMTPTTGRTTGKPPGSSTGSKPRGTGRRKAK